MSTLVFCQNPLTESQKNDITSFIEKTIQELEITGAAVAIVKDSQVVYKNYFGLSNLEHQIPVSESSLFRLHSLSKIFVSVGIFQLVEQQKIALDDKISTYLTDLPEEWKTIQIKHLLSHASGLPDMKTETSLEETITQKNIYSKNIRFPLGERADYNQTNFWLLNRIIRVVTQDSFETYIMQQFEDDTAVRFSSVHDIVPNRVMEYKPDSNGKLTNFIFVVPKYLYGAAGMTMSLNDLIGWDKNLHHNRFMSEASKEKMWTPFQYKNGKGFSYGWDIQKLNGVTSYGFNGGGLVNYRIFPSRGISVIWLTNGYRKPHNIDTITNTLVGFVDEDLIDETPKFSEKLTALIRSKNSNKFPTAYDRLKRNYPHVDYERAINALGYLHLQKRQVDTAIALFQLNTQEYPDSANAFDSLAEAYFITDQFALSEENYLRSLQLNPLNKNAIRMIDEIKHKK